MLAVLLVLYWVSHGAQCSSLPPPLDVGVVVKVGEELIRDIAQKIADKAVQELKAAKLSDSIRDGKMTYNYWNLKFTEISLDPPLIDLSKSSSSGELTVDASLSGDVRVTGQWRVQRKTWVGTLSATGGVVVQMSAFSVTSRVKMGSNDEGVVGFRHDPRYCRMNVGNFDVDFSGRTGWILNLVVSLFKSALEDAIEEKICEVINEKADEVAQDLEDSVLDRYDFIDVLGHNIVFNNRPWTITGGDTCAVIGILGEIETEGTNSPEKEPTTPFIKPTTEPKAVDPEEPTTVDPEEPTTDPAEGEEMMATVFSTSSSFTSSSVTEVVEKIRRRRDVTDICNDLPGGSSAVSVVVTEEMVERIANNLHKLRLIDYKAVQSQGTSNTFQQFWGSRYVGEVSITTTHDLLKDYHIKFHIVGTAPPNITIDTDGVFILSQLRTRITLTGEAFTGKLELYTSGQFLIKILLEFRGGIYRLVPSIELHVDVDDVRLQLGSSLGGRMSSSLLEDSVVDEMEEQLNDMLTNKLPALMKEELREGLPVNVPNCVTIEQAEIVYRQDYILITAQDVIVTL